MDQNRHLSIKVTYCSNSKNVEFTRKTGVFVITFKKWKKFDFEQY